MAAATSDSKAREPGRAGRARASAGRLRRAGAGRRWHTLAIALLAATLACLPRAAPAGLWSADTATGYGLEAELRELRALREEIARRAALRHDLRRRVERLSGAIAALRARAEQARGERARQGDALRAHELALDRVVPRLVTRQRVVEQRHAQAVRVLADLAGLSRRQELSPELRARLHAIGPVLAGALGERDRASAALVRQRDRLVTEQRRLAAQLPVLGAEIARLDAKIGLMREQRRHVLPRLVGLDAELRRLTRAGAALARPLLAVAAAHAARVEPGAGRPVPVRADRVVAGAAVRGEAVRAAAVAPASHAEMAMIATAAEVTRAPAPLRLRPTPALAVRQSLRAARVVAGRDDRIVVAGLRGGATPSPRARPVSIAMSVAGVSSRVAPALLPAPAPIRPTPAVAARGEGHATGMTIGAVPGQRVAAPRDGRIVFADAFKGYGLLLIIEHDSEYHTLLWGFSRLRVAVGDEVRGGEIVGIMDLIDGVPPRLGVELRRRGRPVGPLPWLAASSSKVRG
jgi:murein DD-endopeptidase MepM/ murein hydrolase activator NlpD